MRCPFCGSTEDRVVDSRESRDGDAIRRRRECLGCGRRFTSYERVEEIPLMVVKRDGSREEFNRRKRMDGLLKACGKRPVPVRRLEEIVEEVETLLAEREDREITTFDIGAHVMGRLRDLDQVAYVRFASIYHNFEDVKQFAEFIKSEFE